MIINQNKHNYLSRYTRIPPKLSKLNSFFEIRSQEVMCHYHLAGGWGMTMLNRLLRRLTNRVEVISLYVFIILFCFTIFPACRFYICFCSISRRVSSDRDQFYYAFNLTITIKYEINHNNKRVAVVLGCFDMIFLIC